ncbi:unnamed protein product [Onchocerca flexuosa]|uniref:E2F_TDP domain-containing protein n=1 Tax=Onchocerca flexuosa TaxID=387005 RepID=A0A183H3R1_9BILA|nr:unnamed protein product [Onchocerca flexuosa]
MTLQDSEYSSTSQGLLSDENLPTLTAIDLNVNPCVEDIRKRKALKMRNVVDESLQSIDMIKIEQSENRLRRSVGIGQNRNKIEIGWNRNTSNDSVGGKNRDENRSEIKCDKNFSIDYEKSNEHETEVKWIENDLEDWDCNKNLDESRKEAKWGRNFPTGQKDYGKMNKNERKVKRIKDTFKNQGDGDEVGQSGSKIKCYGNILTDQNDYKKPNKSRDEIKWNGNGFRNQNDNEKPNGSGDEIKWDGNILKDSDDIKESNGKKDKIKMNSNILIDQNDGERLDENRNKIKWNGNAYKDQDGDSDGKNDDVENNENVFGSENRDEVLNENGGEVEWNGNDLINQNEVEESDRNAEWNGQNGNAARHQKGEEESNNGFPRKTKTLGLLCRKFFLKVLEYVDSGDDKINLEVIACSMEVEKRRIYDVVNVMEALGAMEKSHKSFYTWKGLDNLPSTLHTLKTEAEKEGIYEKVLLTQHIMTRFMEVPNKNGNASPSEAGPSRTSDDKIISTLERSNSAGNKDGGSVSSKQSGSKKESKRQRGLNSLTYLCKYFFKILIVGLDYQPDYKVSLDVASTILIKDPEIDGCKPPDRSRCRRIYDVANVLISLRLIERRMFTFGTKKIPLFVYCGPNIIENGKFDFFYHIRFNKLSVKLKNSEEKKAYEVEEENLEIKEKKKEAESSVEINEPAKKRSRIEEIDPIRESTDFGKENIPSTLINQRIAPGSPMIVSIVRPQPQKVADLRSVLVPQTSSSFNALQSVVQQPRFTQFIPLPICPAGFLPFDPNIIFLNNGVSTTRIPMQHNFNHLNAYPLSSMAFSQQPRGPIIDTANRSYTAYNNSNSSFTSPRNILRPSLFNIDAILGNREAHDNNQG